MTISTTNQVVKFIPRLSQSTYNAVIIDEMTKEEITKTVVSSIVGNYHSVDLDFTPLENHFYNLILANEFDGTIYFKGRIFCTNQENEKYTTQKDNYTSFSSDNDYIIYE